MIDRENGVQDVTHEQ